MFDYIAVLLTLLYTVLFVLGLIQIRHVFITRKYKISTVRNGIIMILTLGALLRIIFWFKVSLPTELPNQLVMSIYYLPVWLDFAGLSLLAVFYSETLLTISQKYNNYKYYPMRICLVFNLIFFLLSILISLLLNNKDTSLEVKSNISTCFSVFASFLDFLLAGMLGFLGYNFYESYASYKVTVRLLPRSLQTFAAINWYVVIAYLLRGLFTAAVGSVKMIPVSEGSIIYNGEHPPTGLTILFFFIFTEWLPSLCVIFLLWRRVMSKRRANKLNIYVNNDGSGIIGNEYASDNIDDDDKLLYGSRAISKDNERISIYIEDDDDEDDDDDDNNTGNDMTKGLLTNEHVSQVEEYIFGDNSNNNVFVATSEAEFDNNSNSSSVNNMTDVTSIKVTSSLLSVGGGDKTVGDTNGSAGGTHAASFHRNSWNGSINKSQSPALTSSYRTPSPSLTFSRTPSPSLSSSYTGSMSKSLTDKYSAPNTLSSQHSLLQHIVVGRNSIHTLPSLPEVSDNFDDQCVTSDSNFDNSNNSV